jgi:LemA protein
MYDTGRGDGVNKGLVGCGVIVAIAVGLIATWAGSYDRLVKLNEAVDSAWGEVDGAYQRRAEIASTLMGAARGGGEIERDALAQLVEAHAAMERIDFESAPDSEQLAEFEAAQSRLSSALSRVVAAAGPYPGLEAAENEIALAQQRFNDATLLYNKTRRRFPTILLAKVAGFDNKPYLDATPAR